MGGIVIDIWEKSNFFQIIWITKSAKTDFCSGRALKAPSSCGLKYVFFMVIARYVKSFPDDVLRKYEGLSETADESNLIYFAWYGSDINIKAAAKYCRHDHRLL